MATKHRRRTRAPGDTGDTGPKGDRAGVKRSRTHTLWRSLLTWCVLGVTLALLAGSFVWINLSGDDEVMEVLAAQREAVQHKFFHVPCSQDYDNLKRFAGCTPSKCGRAITDSVITQQEAERMLRLAEAGLSLGGSDGGASILDLHSGALSMGKKFVNMYRSFGEKVREIMTEDDFKLYREIRLKIQKEIARTFGINASSLYLTKPTFFSRMNSSKAKTTHDEYWHPHIDKVTYGSFDYTSLLYLSDYSRDFGGGRFVFIDEPANRTVEPRAGRVSFFTSGSENLHRVEKVNWGTRYAITISFTCDPKHAIEDPKWT
ncbi:2-oxoglutarate and iron-dependent oxygenase domain-containing protein 3 [Rhinophrynus dorsalis]